MKTKSILFLAAFHLLAAWATAQKMNCGQAFVESQRVTVTGIMLTDPNGFIVIKPKIPIGPSPQKHNYTLQKFDKNLSSTLVNTIALGFEDKILDIDSCYQSNGTIYLFTSFVNRKLDKSFLFVQKVNSKTLQPEGSLVKIAEVNYKNSRTAGKFDYSFSRDNSSVLVYANTEYRRNEPEKYALHVFDSNMKPRWSKEIILPYTETSFEIQDYCVDHNGNVFLVGKKKMQQQGARSNDGPDYEYIILGYYEGGSEVREYTVSIGDKFLNEMKIDVSPDEDIICAGFYSESGQKSIKGTYYLRIDRKSKEIVQITSKEFDLELITMNLTESRENKVLEQVTNGQNVELYKYKLRGFIPREDGGVILLGEQYFVKTHDYTSPGSSITRTNYYYHFNDIIVVNVNPAGEIEWATKIPKRQSSANDIGFYLSFTHIVIDGKLYLIYNDTKLNLTDGQEGKYAEYGLGNYNGIIMLAIVDAEGKVERRAIHSDQKFEDYISPKHCLQIGTNQMLMVARNSKGSQFGIVTF
jgi:hypothetical protein